MKWSYRFNPDMPFGREMIPSSENDKFSSVHHRGYGKIIHKNKQ